MKILCMTTMKSSKREFASGTACMSLAAMAFVAPMQAFALNAAGTATTGVPLAKAEKRPGWDGEKFTMGAIRWDAWYGFGETDTVSKEACGTLMHPDHRWKMPFFADVAADGKVTN